MNKIQEHIRAMYYANFRIDPLDDYRASMLTLVALLSDAGVGLNKELLVIRLFEDMVENEKIG